MHEKPKQIRYAVALLWCTFAQVAITALLTHPLLEMEEKFQFQPPLLVVVMIILMFLIPNVSAGRNWARIIVICLAIFGILFDIATAADVPRNDLFWTTLDLIGDIALVIAAYLIGTKPGSTWFKERRTRQAPVF